VQVTEIGSDPGLCVRLAENGTLRTKGVDKGALVRAATRLTTMTTAEPLRLLVFGPSWGAPSLDAACSKAYAHLLFCGLVEGTDFVVEPCNNPHRSLGGELPVLEFGAGQLAEGPHEVCTALAARGYDADKGLSPAQRAESTAFAALLEERLHVALLYSWWEDEENYNAVVRPALTKALPLPLCYYLPWSMRKRVHSQLARRSCHRADVAYAHGEAAIEALAVRLGEARPFFHGDTPTSVDASAFAYLSAVLRCPLPNERLRAALRVHTNLVAYCERISSRFFGGSGPLLPAAAPASAAPPPHHPLGTAAAAAAQAEVGRAAEAATKKSRTPKEANFRRRSRNAVLAAAGATLLYALATDSLAFAAQQQDEEDEQQD
jgi:metaxin